MTERDSKAPVNPQDELSRLRAESILLRAENASLRTEVSALRGPGTASPTEALWRVNLAEQGLQGVKLRWERDTWVASSGSTVIRNADAIWCVAEFARHHWGDIPVEILAPGQLSRAEAVAAERGGCEALVGEAAAKALRLYQNSSDKDEQTVQLRIHQVAARLKDALAARKEGKNR